MAERFRQRTHNPFHAGSNPVSPTSHTTTKEVTTDDLLRKFAESLGRRHPTELWYVRDMDEVFEILRYQEKRIDELESSQAANQAEIDADAAAIEQVSTDLTAAVAVQQAEIDALKAAATAGQALDFSKLEGSTAALDAAAKAVGTLVPTPPAPPAP